MGRSHERPRPSPAQKSDDGSAGKGQQRVWILKDGWPVAVPVTTGSTSGSLTEVIAGDLQPGMPVIVDIVTEGK